MWEAIRQNQRKSWMLILGMAVFLAVVGSVLGAAATAYMSAQRGAGAGVHTVRRVRPVRPVQPVQPVQPARPVRPVRPAEREFQPQRFGGENADVVAGATVGAGVALIVWLVMTITALASGDRILLASAGAHEVTREVAPQLWNVVEEMTIASGLAKPPRVFLIEDEIPNAFAVGRKPEKASVAVTSGLLRRLNRDELQGVIAHEIGHVRNLDVRFMTLAAVMVSSIVILSQVFLRSMYYGGGRRRTSRRGEGKGNALAAILMVVGILLAILAPILANLLYLACSRRREYLADASAARFTRYPAGLASALEKIALPFSGKTVSGESGFAPESGALRAGKPNKALAPLYIVNPLQTMSASSVFSTHPPTEARIRVLRAMGGGAGYADYEAAYKKILGGKSSCLDARTLEAEGGVAAREAASEESGKRQKIVQGREALDVLGQIAGFLFLACSCGMRIKLPPGYDKAAVRCPRCGAVHNVSEAASAPPRLRAS